MKSNTDLQSESGSAVLDLVAFGVLLQIPILMFATLTASYQAQAIAIESIARQALRAHVLWPDLKGTSLLVEDLVRDFSLEPSKLKWQLRCLPLPDCSSADSTIEIEVRYGELEAYGFQQF